jgi:hypothetical protein
MAAVNDPAANISASARAAALFVSFPVFKVSPPHPLIAAKAISGGSFYRFVPLKILLHLSITSFFYFVTLEFGRKAIRKTVPKKRDC